VSILNRNAIASSGVSQGAPRTGELHFFFFEHNLFRLAFRFLFSLVRLGRQPSASPWDDRVIPLLGHPCILRRGQQCPRDRQTHAVHELLQCRRPGHLDRFDPWRPMHTLGPGRLQSRCSSVIFHHQRLDLGPDVAETQTVGRSASSCGRIVRVPPIWSILSAGNLGCVTDVSNTNRSS
jgi:hypothetical protein